MRNGASSDVEGQPHVRARFATEFGTTIVEFAIIGLLLLMLVLGGIDLGSLYTNYQAVRGGTRDATREFVVNDVANDTSCTRSITVPASPTTYEASLVCRVKKRVGTDQSRTRVRICFPGADGVCGNSDDRSNYGDQMIVCVMYPIDSISGLLSPFLSGKRVTTKFTMRIEQQLTTVRTIEETPSRGTWAFC